MAASHTQPARGSKEFSAFGLTPMATITPNGTPPPRPSATIRNSTGVGIWNCRLAVDSATHLPKEERRRKPTSMLTKAGGKPSLACILFFLPSLCSYTPLPKRLHRIGPAPIASRVPRSSRQSSFINSSRFDTTKTEGRIVKADPPTPRTEHVLVLLDPPPRRPTYGRYPHHLSFHPFKPPLIALCATLPPVWQTRVYIRHV